MDHEIDHHGTQRTFSRRDLLDQLEIHIRNLKQSDAWVAYLRAQSRFHHYSPRNVMLIAMQRPDATNVAGFTTWKELGRSVIRGERGINILAPVLTKTSNDDSEALTGFRWVSVFDIAQTHGRPLPSPVVLLHGESPGAIEAELEHVVASFGFSLHYERLPFGVNGECRWQSRLIVIEPQNPGLQRVKTIVHELAHALLHEHQVLRDVAEIEAEAVAFLVLAALGFDSSPYSAGYLATWLGDDQEISEAIARSWLEIQHASDAILGALRRFSSHPLDEESCTQTSELAHSSTLTGSNMGRKGILASPISGRTQST